MLGHALNFANKVANRLPSSSNEGLSPNDMWGGRRSDLNIDFAFGCKAFARRYVRGKMEPNAVECIALGIAEDYKAFIVRALEGGKARAFYSRDVRFFTNQFPYRHALCKIPIADPIEDDEEDLESVSSSSKSTYSTIIPSESNIDDNSEANKKFNTMELNKTESPRMIKGTKAFVVDRDDITKEMKVFQVQVVDNQGPEDIWIQFKGDKKKYGGYKVNQDIYTTREIAEKAMSEYSDGSDIEEEALAIMKNDSRLKIEAVEGLKKTGDDATIEDWSWIKEEDPVNRTQMLKHKRADRFVEGEKDEMKVMAAQRVWKLVPREPGMNV